MKDLNLTFPNGATSITFCRLNMSDTIPCKIRSRMPFDKFPVDPSDYRTSEHDCPKDMVATGIILDEDDETTTLVCSPTYDEDQLDNDNCKQLKIPYVANTQADWTLIYPFEAKGYCPNGFILTGIDYLFDKPYFNIRCCARKDIDEIIDGRDKRIRILVWVVIILVAIGILFILFRLYNNKKFS